MELCRLDGLCVRLGEGLDFGLPAGKATFALPGLVAQLLRLPGHEKLYELWPFF